jgi:hypothetical protein
MLDCGHDRIYTHNICFLTKHKAEENEVIHQLRGEILMHSAGWQESIEVVKPGPREKYKTRAKVKETKGSAPIQPRIGIGVVSPGIVDCACGRVSFRRSEDKIRSG